MRYIPLRSLLPVCLVILGTGCGTLPNGHRWGEDVSFGSWEKIKTATLNAATDPETWVPVAGALLLSLGDLDEDLSDWAIRETPTTRKLLRLTAKTLAAGTAWARVEAGKHYPTDVLAGAAIGHFLTAVMHDSFMGLDETAQVDVQVDRREGAMLSFSWLL